MQLKHWLPILICAASLAIGAAASAQMPAEAGGEKKPAPEAAPPVPPAPKPSATHHTLTIDGKAIPYTATAGLLDIKDEKGDVTARMSYVAYTKDGVTDLTRRPITFAYNGGPGSSTIWLHMGAFGPMRVVTSDAQPTPPPPYQLVDNQDSLLDKSDLVFIDAPGTGYGRIVGKGTPKDFYGVDQDIKAFGQFIERYITEDNRWNSPRFLLGESYGTTRSAALVNYLQENGIACNGVILISSILNFETESFNTGNDLPYITNIPSYAAIAWYHDKLNPKPADLEAFLNQVKQFAFGEYADALMEGSKLSATTKADVEKKLAQYTGVSEKFWDEANLRVNASRFRKELLRGDRRTVGRLDARFLGIDHDAAGEFPEYDSADTAFSSAFTAAFNDYEHNNLKFGRDMDYKVTNYGAGPWDWKHKIGGRGFGWPGYLDVAEDLREAMTKNPHLKVFVGCGYYDLATPFGAAEYTMDHLGLEPSLQKNVRFGYYRSGHMLYLHLPALEKLKGDLSVFYDAAVAK